MADSPYRLTSVIVGGGLLAAAGFLGASLRSVHSSFPLRIACLTVVMVGLAVMIWAAHILRQGVKNERWSEGALAPVRAVIDHPAWTWAMGLLVLALLVLVVAEGHPGGYYWAVFCALQIQTQVSSCFRRTRKSQATGFGVNWSVVSPLSSEHWGER